MSKIIWALKADASNGGPTVNEIRYRDETLVAIHLPKNCIILDEELVAGDRLCRLSDIEEYFKDKLKS